MTVMAAERADGLPLGDELEQETLRGCRAGDPAAFRAFVLRYQRSVFAFLSRSLGPGPHVEDLAQEVFLKAFRAFPRFDPGGPARPSTWLLTIAVRTAIDARKRRIVRTAAMDEGVEVADPATPETERRRREIGRALARAVGELPEEQRDAFVLAEFHGLGIAEIAAVLEVPEGTAKTRLFRARERLRAALGDWMEA